MSTKQNNLKACDDKIENMSDPNQRIILSYLSFRHVTRMNGHCMNTLLKTYMPRL